MKRIMFIMFLVGHMHAISMEFRAIPNFFIATIKNDTTQKIDVTSYDTKKIIASVAAQTSLRVNYPINLRSKDFLKEFKFNDTTSQITLTVQLNIHKKNYFDVLLYIKKGIMGKSLIVSSWSNSADPQKNYNINVILKGDDLAQSVLNVVPAITSKESTGFEL